MKTLLRKALALSGIVLLVTSAGNFLSAQSQYCGTDGIMRDLLQNNPQVVIAQQELEAFTEEYVRTHEPEMSERGGPAYIIPIVFHIIHDNGLENVTDATITTAVDILNEDYQKLNTDTSLVQWSFKHLIGDANIEFRLAQKDPDGNCTNGIDRVFSYRTYQGNDRSKVVVWDRKHYLNIWVVNRIASAGVAAYAYLPAGATGLGYKVDGVIAWYQYVGAGQRTLTHEIGHSFNLSHTWGGGEVGAACGDDGVDDTPITEGELSNCPGNNQNGKIDFTCDADPIGRTWQFDSVTTSTGQTDPYPAFVVNPNTPDTALTLMNFNASDSLSANSAVAGEFAFSNWDTGAVNGIDSFGSHLGTMNLNKYYEFTLRPQLGQGLRLTGIRFYVKRSDTGPRMFAVRSSETSNFGSNLAATVLPANSNLTIPPLPAPQNTFYFAHDTSVLVKQGRITLNGTAYTDIDDTVTFRIYAWNAEDAAGTFSVDSVAITGTYGTIENKDNYMDYTFCDNMFTIGQVERMHAALESNISFRDSLWTPENHARTGIDNPQLCAPQADFYVKRTMACQGAGSPNNIQFFDNSTRGTVATRTWTFPNGTPPTSTQINPTVTFNEPYSVSATLTVQNTAGSSTVTKDNIAWIAPNWVDHVGLYYQDFEDPSQFNTMYRVENRSGNASSWQVASNGTFPSGTHGVKINAYSPMIVSTNTTPPIVLDWGIGAFDKDVFITPAFDLFEINSGTAKLEFKLSGATRASTGSDMTDSLQVQYSTNCGNTWLSFPGSGMAAGRYSLANLSNAGSYQSEYAPSTTTQWVQRSINLPVGALAHNVRFKFEYLSGYFSNNIYIDDINISGTVGIDDPGAFSADLRLFPNPSGGDVAVSYRLSASRHVKLEVFDAIGNLVESLIDIKQAAGSYSVSFKTSKMSNGVYYVKLSGDNANLKTEKLVVIK